ncbi:DNA ligase D [Flavobacterium aquicola]|uniref:DNA ligase (ATP) n=1 Tax=Flavobacterium aquicola TaxID=1682742 RepID=A0A3E0EFN6_9FLAO|nr:DNA ligase D [Flavobacterium aquicola]REG96089.1 ATP-dependent DNA ligase LigD phosphoesterase module /ATP-dependent DNA ligase LigD polymerase module [Flavobacterium aquicola]
MSLQKYNQKRNFTATDEPQGKVDRSESELIFVVQKHAASHLHYDFRLEMEGVLKSWAVPKGPSLDPEIKRLAMMVEDHPYSYKDFEGNIPEGNYGAGNVIVWDNGIYLPSDEDFKGTAENKLLADLAKGHLSFTLKGKKLKGDFSLVKLKGKQENAWLLIKKEDKYVSKDDILVKDKSVISKLSLDILEKQKAKNVKEKIVGKKQLNDAKAGVDIKNNSSKEALVFHKPMLAGLVEKPFDNADWVFENKYDGYRTLAVINDENVQLFSRNEISFTKNFKAVADDLQKLNHRVILDGEVVVEDESGRSNFQLLQNYLKTGKGKIKYYVFDILNLDGSDTTQLTLLERKELLQLLLAKFKFSAVFYSDHIHEKGIDFLALAAKKESEGIIAKKADSVYSIGKRTGDWLKIKLSQQEEAVIIGITEPKNSRSYFGALLLGQYENGILKFIGKCGTGFTQETLKELHAKFAPHFIKESPLEEKVPLRDKIQWIKPKFICQVKFAEWTQDNHLRQPVYLGLRIDKKAKEVSFAGKNKETVMEQNKEEMEKKESAETENDYDLKVGKTTLHLTNQNKIYFPDDAVTKGDVVNYYSEISDLILPYLKDRPQSMYRFPSGINQTGFYQKDVDLDKIPSWLKTEKIFSESNNAAIDYLICNDKATLLFMANLGCIDINPWNSTIRHIDNPDWVVIDIDPEKDDFKEVVKTALAVKEVMDSFETECYCKTSGASGLHVYIPLGGKYDYDSVKLFAELIARVVNSKLPETTTLERSIKKRNHKIYIDYLQNRKGQTLVAPYSVRPKPGATVSTPLEWSEVNAKLSPSQFTIKNVIKRFEKKGDLWKPVLGKGADIKAVIENIS